MAIKFKGVDFLEIDSLLSDDERLVRDNTRQFIEENLIPIIEQCNRDGRFPKELIRPMGELGFYGASLQGYGCAGMSAVEYGLMTQELERGDSGVRSFGTNAWPQAAVNPVTGDIYVAFDDWGNGSGKDRANIYFTESSDGGRHWS